jgi:ketosteroid isomerase-like protein
MWLALKGHHGFATSFRLTQPRKKFVMKLFTPLLAITLIAFAVTPCARAQDNSAIESNLKQMEDAWGKAIMDKDSATVGNMVADDFAGINSEGKRRNKTQLLDELKNSNETLSASTNDSMEVHVYGPNLATVVGISTEKGKDKDGKQFSHSFGWVDTWMLRNGKWECVGEAVTQIPKKK